MKRSIAISATVCTLSLSTAMMFFGTSAAAQSIECGSTYTVKRGDSLTRIAVRAYGNVSDFQLIYSANARRIGSNPGRITVGMPLSIPCAGETVASTAASIAVETTTERLPFPNEREIRIVQGSGWAPFSDETQEQGGMLTEIANVAMSNSAGQTEYKIDFINDWGAHLTPIITDHAYDLALSWFKPNCEQIDRLGEDSQFRCNNFDWSEPMFEQIFGYYTRADEPRLASYSDMLGKTICRPSGYATFQLEENDLKEPNVTLFRPVDPRECFTGLVEGSVDVVALAVDTAEGLMVETNTTDQIVMNDDLSQVLTIHALTSKNHPRGQEILAEFNSGLNAIKETGEWFQIVRRHLIEHRAKTQG